MIPWKPEQKEAIRDLIEEFGRTIPWKELQKERPKVWSLLTTNPARSEKLVWSQAHTIRRKMAQEKARASRGSSSGSAAKHRTISCSENNPAANQGTAVNFCPNCGFRLLFINKALDIERQMK